MDEWSEFARTLLNYSYMIGLGLLGGFANYVTKLRQNKAKAFSVVELAGELMISGFVALMTAFVCMDLGFSDYATYAACGISGHLGTRGLYMAEQKILQWLERL